MFAVSFLVKWVFIYTWGWSGYWLLPILLCTCQSLVESQCHLLCNHLVLVTFYNSLKQLLPYWLCCTYHCLVCVFLYSLKRLWSRSKQCYFSSFQAIFYLASISKKCNLPHNSSFSTLSISQYAICSCFKSLFFTLTISDY